MMSARLLVLGLVCFVWPGVSGLNNGLARTPPMGWMSWAQFWCEIDCVHKPYSCISQQLYMDMADRIAADGYLDVGYRGVHIDDCWMSMQRDPATDRLTANSTRFPDGIPALAQYMHAQGVTLGIYEDYGTKTCGGYPGSFGHLTTDAQTFADWQCDYLKLDGCYNDIKNFSTGYPQMEVDLNATGRPIVYSCSWPAYVVGSGLTPNYTQIAQSCNLWRNYDDVAPNWASIQNIIDWYTKHQDEMIPVHGPGQWNDPDMLVIGQPTITVDQAKVQMSIWCIWAAPLIMSNDLRLIAPVFAAILQNRAAIGINQDPLGRMGRCIRNVGPETQLSIYVKEITPFDTVNQQYSYGVVFFNRDLKQQVKVSMRLAKFGLKNPAGYFVSNVWTGEQLGLMRPKDTFTGVVPPTGVIMLRADIAQSRDLNQIIIDF